MWRETRPRVPLRAGDCAGYKNGLLSRRPSFLPCKSWPFEFIMADQYIWPSRFLDLKREIVSATTQERLTASWNDLLNELATRTAEIARAGPDVSLV